LKKVFNLLLLLNRSTTVSTTGMAMFRTNRVLLRTLAGNYASNNVPNSYTELKVGYAARLFYGDAFANQKSTGCRHFGEGFAGYFLR
jgi:hypothetical protein